MLAEARARGAKAACAGGRLDFDTVLRSVAALHQAGLQVLAGTDANYPEPDDGHPILNAFAGHGIALHHELALLVQVGLPPAAALAAATSAPARLFGLTDRGRSAAGLRADLLLVDGDPCADITAPQHRRDLAQRHPAAPPVAASPPPCDDHRICGAHTDMSSGITMKRHDQPQPAELGAAQQPGPSAARTARPARHSRGALTWRWSTAA